MRILTISIPTSYVKKIKNSGQKDELRHINDYRQVVSVPSDD